MKVKLLGKIQEPERLIAAATLATRNPEGAAKLIDKIDELEMKRTIINALKRGHEGIAEFAVYIISIEGVSRVLTHQLVRHRIASYLQMSSRHVDLSSVDYVTPKKIKENSKMLKTFEDSLKQSFAAYKELLEGEIEFEDARYLLPDGICTNIVMCMNARSLGHFFDLRLCYRAQDEIRELAESVRDIVREEDPHLFIDAERPCIVTGICREGPDKCSRKFYHSKEYEVELKEYKERKKDATS